MSGIITRNEIIALAKQLATPIDYVKLQKNGIIEKKGAWYKIKNMKALPKHASKQIRSMKIDDKGNCYVKFPVSWTRAQLLYRKMTRKEYDE